MLIERLQKAVNELRIRSVNAYVEGKYELADYLWSKKIEIEKEIEKLK